MRIRNRMPRPCQRPAAAVLAVLAASCGAADRTVPQAGTAGPASSVPSCGAVVPEDARGNVACILRGAQQLASGDVLYAAATGPATLARFTGGDLGIDVAELSFADAPRAKVAVRTPADGPAVRLEGWIDLARLDVRAQRSIDVVPDAVWIRQGSPLLLVAGRQGSVWVRARYGSLAGLTAEVDCEALGLVRSEEQPWVQPPGRATTMREGAATIQGAPETPPFCRLVGEDAPQPQLYALESRNGYELVALDDADYRLTAWIPADQLQDGVVPDCDDCRGAVLDAEDLDELPATARTVVAAREAAVRGVPEGGSPSIGAVEGGATVVVLEEQAGWGRIRPRTFGIVPPDAPPGGTAPPGEFWVLLADLGEP